MSTHSVAKWQRTTGSRSLFLAVAGLLLAGLWGPGFAQTPDTSCISKIVSVRGEVKSFDPDARSLTIEKIYVRTNEKTVFTNSRGARISFEDFAVGKMAYAVGTPVAEGVMLAAKIILLDSNTEPKPTCTPCPTRTPCPTCTPRPTCTPCVTPEPTTHTLPVWKPVTLEGRITWIARHSWYLRVNNRLLKARPHTVIVDSEGNWVRFRDLNVGDCVTVSGRELTRSKHVPVFADRIVKGDCEPTTDTDPTPTRTPLPPPITPKPTCTPRPTPEPTVEPTVAPTVEPTVEPTAEPTVEPTVGPTPEPTEEPTPEPTPEPTDEPPPATPTPTVTPFVTETETPVPSPTVDVDCGIEVTGQVVAVNLQESTITVDGVVILILAETSLLDAQGNAIALADFAAGDTVVANGCGQPSFGLLFAKEVKKAARTTQPRLRK